MPRNALVLDRHSWLGQIDRWSDQLLGLGLFFAAVFLLTINLGTLPLRDWDEGTVAQVARAIWRSEPGSLGWLYPIVNGEPYLNKPLLMHWLIAGFYHLGGVNEWTSRLPGALLTAGSVPTLYGIGREVFMRRSPAVIAALVYLTMLPVVRHGRLAMLDGAVLCFFLLLVWCLLRSRRNPRWALGVGIGFGLIALTKGILAVLLGAIAVLFLAWDSPRLLTSPYLWGGFFVGSAPAAVWYSAQWLHYGELFFRTHVLAQSFDRIGEAVEDHAAPPWYYLLEILKYSVPWLIFFPQALQIVWHSRNMSWAKLVLVWGGGYLLVISLMGTKLPWYVLPIYPAIALAVSVPLYQIWQHSSVLSNGEKPSMSYSKGWISLGGVLAMAGWAGSAYFAVVSPQPSLDLQIILAAFGLTMTTATLLALKHDRQFIVILLWGMYVSLTLLMLSNHWIWELAEDYPVKPVAVLLQQSTASEQKIYTSHAYNRPSLNFYSDREVVSASDQKLQQQWQRHADPYFLLDQSALDRLKLPRLQTIGESEGWALVKRKD